MRHDFLRFRPRRRRQSGVIRALCRETRLSVAQLVYPLFVQEGRQNTPIASMPGQKRWSVEGLLKEMEEATALGIQSFALFPVIGAEKKTATAVESYNEKGLMARALGLAKSHFPQACLIADVALDPYNSDGHDGLLSPDGEVLNDETLPLLLRMSLVQAEAGADILAPSDMMDGRIGFLRDGLDEAGFRHKLLLSYAVKYASSLYGPFREALGSSPARGDKKTYQMDVCNAREAQIEARLDEEEGADMLMVKPAGMYLDIVHRIRQQTNLPVAAYQVSGEYAMICAGAKRGCFDLEDALSESLLAIRRAGADVIFTYFAKHWAQLSRTAG